LDVRGPAPAWQGTLASQSPAGYKRRQMTDSTGTSSATDTIFALASGRGRAGIAVVRVSGPRAGACIEALTGAPPPSPRKASLRDVVSGAGELIDQGLVLWFPGPESFTGEDVAELQLHGGAAVLDAVFVELMTRPGLRPAEAGEFSRRAFEAGKLDLTAAEGLNDLVMAETAAQRAQALSQLRGELAGVYEGWRATLVEALSHIEAYIDFPDEEIPPETLNKLSGVVESLAEEIRDHLTAGHRGERVRTGFEIVIIGAPNAGKSTLLNRLARADVAIVTDEPGTTRDLIEVRLDMAGFLVTLVDTAGLRDSKNKIEAEGVRRARSRAASADLQIWLLDSMGGLTDQAAAVAEGSATPDRLTVLNKIDLIGAGEKPDPGRGALQAIRISAKTGEGIDELLEEIEGRVVAALEGDEAPSLTRARHRAALERSLAALEKAGSALKDDIVLAAEDLRLAARALGEITGAVDIEEILDIIFREFCIGK